MNRRLYLNCEVDPRELAINLRFKENSVIHPRVRAAQDALITLLKASIREGADYLPCHKCRLTIHLSFPRDASDIDGPIKRIMDAIEKAHKALGYDWNDRYIRDLRVTKDTGFTGMVLSMSELGEDV